MDISSADMPGASEAIRDAMDYLCDCAEALRNVASLAARADAEVIRRAFGFVTEAQGALLTPCDESDAAERTRVQDDVEAAMRVVGGVR